VPLKCHSPEGPLFAFDYDRASFEALRLEHRKRHHLSLTCCDAPLGLRVSKTGTPHFYHLKGGDNCECGGPESEDHLRITRDTALAVRKAGWGCDVEVLGRTPGGKTWRADVLAVNGQRKVAIEAQWTRQTWADTVVRHQRYLRSGLKALWLFKQKDFPVEFQTPAFRIRPLEGGYAYEVLVSRPDELDLGKSDGDEFGCLWVPLEQFVVAALTRHLQWAPGRKLSQLRVKLRVSGKGECCGRTLWYPHGFEIAAPLPHHRGLIWSRTWDFCRYSNWYPALCRIANEQAEGCGIAIPKGRYHDMQCPTCGSLARHVFSGDGRSLNFDVPISRLPPVRPDTEEWRFIYRWWMNPTLDADSMVGLPK